MNCTYFKHKEFKRFYKFVGEKQVLIMNLNKTNFEIVYLLVEECNCHINNVKSKNLLVTITKEEFDIVMNSAILRMIEISILLQ